MAVPKILGADVELSNFVLGMPAAEGTGRLASRRLLAAIPGISSGVVAGPQGIDWGRKYLPSNGGCCYIDSDHLEIALSETRSAFDHVAYWRAMLQVARDAMHQASADLPDGCRLQVLANNSDGQGNSYGSHVSVLLTRDAWDTIFCRRAHYLAYLAAFQISSIVLTGQGKVGAERGRAGVDFQLSQRADFFETLVSLDTMHFRGVVNSRDEPLCGPGRLAAQPPLARLHVIFYDSTLCQIATVLRAGLLQMVVAMIEAGFVNPNLALDDPLDALHAFSRSPDLTAEARLVNGLRRRAVDLQWGFLSEATRFASRGGFAGVVPDVPRLLGLWEGTLAMLDGRDFDALSRRLDWVLKQRLLGGVLDRRPDLTWQSPALRHLDQLYASVDEHDSPFWALERSGHVDQVVDAAAVARAAAQPPDDTRAWTRAHLLRAAGGEQIDLVDWDRVRVSLPAPQAPFWRTRTASLPLPHGHTRADNERHFVESSAPLAAILDELAAGEAAAATVVADAPGAARPWTIKTGDER
jgi:proteasome accessory factor A